MSDFRQYASATGRNREPILAVLKQILPAAGTVLEIASGTGEHAAFFAPRLASLSWIPTEQDELLRRSIQAWGESAKSKNLILPPLALNVSDRSWPVEDADFALPIVAIANINMIHISAWKMCEHLMAGAQRVLPAGGVLYLYGPFKQGGEMATSNEAFDRSLRDRNADWGIRDLEAVARLAERCDLQLTQTIEMPANNLSVVFTHV